jgi:Flp pilus assembly protein TadG
MRTSKSHDSNVVRSILRMRARTMSEVGSALVEFCLTMPVLAALLVGAAELGWMTYASVEVANAARAGVSYGCQTSATAGDTTGIQNTAAADAPDITLGTTTVSTSCICSDGSAATGSGCLPASCTNSQPETILTVQTQATVTPFVHIPGLPASFTLHGQAVQKVLQ